MRLHAGSVHAHCRPLPTATCHVLTLQRTAPNAPLPSVQPMLLLALAQALLNEGLDVPTRQMAGLRMKSCLYAEVRERRVVLAHSLAAVAPCF